MDDSQQAVAILSHTWFGSELPPQTQARLASLSSIQEFQAGDVLLREGEDTTEIGIVLSGRLALQMFVPERGVVTILSVEPGDLFGQSALTPPHKASSTVVATEDGRALIFGGPELRAALKEDHALAASLYPRVLTAVNRRLNATRLQLLDLFAR